MRAQPPASHYIDGAPVEDTAGAPIDVIYPYTGEVIARVHAATPAVLDRALAAAERAQADWAARPPVERGRVLRRAAEIIRERNRALSELETLGIVSSAERNKGKGGGKYKLHSLAQSTESVRRGLTDLLDGPARSPH